MNGFEHFEAPFNIEEKILGVWESKYVLWNLWEAVYDLSEWTGWQRTGREVENFRIIDANNKIL